MFINRGNNIQDFNSLVEPASDKWLLVLYGLNGVGKSALLKELSSSYVPGSRYVYVNFDETLYCHEPADFIHEMEAGLKKCDLPESRWEEYRSKCREIDDWKHNQQVILNVSQNVEAIRGQINDVNQEANLQLDRHEWQYQVNISAAREQIQPLVDLCQELGEPFVVFLDHWDTLVRDAGADYIEWVIQGVLRKLQKHLPSIRVVIASDKPLDETTLGSGVKQVELEAFTPPDAALLMNTLGLNDLQTQAAIMSWTGGNPQLIILAVELWKLDPKIELDELAENWSVKAASEWLLKRIMDRLPDERSRKILERGVILRRWRLGDLKQVLNIENLDSKWYDEFIQYPFIEHLSRPPGYMAFIRSVREIQIDQLWHNQKDKYTDIHSNAYRWYTKPLAQV